MAVGDARSLPLATGTVQCCVTSPPYWGLSDYGVPGQLGLEATPDAYVASMVAVFREVRRVLRDDGVVFCNLGDSYAAGGMGGHDRGGNATFHGHSERQGDRIPKKAPDGLKPKDLVGIPWRVAFALQADGWYLRSDIIWAKPNPMPESVTDRPTKSHEYVFLLTKSARYFWDADAVREPHADDWHDRASTWRNGEAKQQSRGESYHPYGEAKPFANPPNPLGRNLRSVWSIATQPYPEAHFATMPEKLVEPCIKAGSKPGDLVLDPFAGSGTVGKVALELNRRFVGVELNPLYVGMARRRMRGVQPRLMEVKP